MLKMVSGNILEDSTKNENIMDKVACITASITCISSKVKVLSNTKHQTQGLFSSSMQCLKINCNK